MKGCGMRIPFGTVTITRTAKELIADCLETGRISGGTLVDRFEKRMAGLLEVEEAVAVSSGTDADTLALAVLHDFGAKRGDEPALSYAATGHAVIHAGFMPVFVDVDLETLNIDVEKIESAITPKTRAIFPVHLLGKPAAMSEIVDIAKRRNLSVIEDAAEAWGAMYNGKPVGSIGDLGAFSLYVAHIITTGDGGLVTTNNREYAEVVRSLRGHGRACACKQCVSTVTGGKCEKRFADSGIGDRRFHFQRIGYSSRMNNLEAALGLGSLEKYSEILEIRRRNLFACMVGFERFQEFFWTFKEEKQERIGPHAFPFVVRKGMPFTREQVLLYLVRHGIDPRTLFGSIPTQCGGYEFLGHRLGDFPNSEYFGTHGLHIGVHQDISPGDVEFFLDTVANFLKAHI